MRYRSFCFKWFLAGKKPISTVFGNGIFTLLNEFQTRSRLRKAARCATISLGRRGGFCLINPDAYAHRASYITISMKNEGDLYEIQNIIDRTQ